MEYYSFPKRNEALLHVKLWMSLECYAKGEKLDMRPHTIPFHLHETCRIGYTQRQTGNDCLMDCHLG